MNTLMQQAIQFANDHESAWDRSVKGNFGVHLNDPPPWNRLLGPIHDRGPVSGVVVVDGKTVASWGEPERADLTFSVAKLYLAILAGVAHDRGLLPDVDEPVGKRVPGIGFDSGQNADITWRHLLQQTSEWEGERFGVSDQADRYRAVTFGVPPDGKKGDARPLQRPGTYWEYNDVRINQLSYACCTCSASRCPRSSARPSPGPSAPARTGNGWATTTPGSRSTASACRRCRAARTGAAACPSAPATRRSSARCC